MNWTYRLRLRHLEMLLSLEQTQSISRSAANLNTTQPALSKWLKDLEFDVGLPLFERSARGLRPTSQGLALIAHARRVTNDLRVAHDDMAALREGGVGRIAIGVSGASAASTAPLAVLRLLRDHSQAAFVLVESPLEQLLDRVRNGEIDVAIGRPVLSPSNPTLGHEQLYKDEINFIVRPDHPLLRRKKPGWDDLLSYRWILWPKGTPTRDAFEHTLRLAGRAVPPLSIESGTVTVNLALIANSDMVCLASVRDMQRYADWNIARGIALPTPCIAEVCMYWRTDVAPAPLLSAALACFRRVASDLNLRTDQSGSRIVR